MPFTVRQISIDDLDLFMAECIQKVWEETNKRLGLHSTPQEILEEQRSFWPNQEDPLLLLALTPDDAVVGYRFAHALPSELPRRVLYDQAGGVIPSHRRRGIGRALLREQHRIAAERGYDVMRTETALDLKPMIILNLQEGFDIVGMRNVVTDKWHTKCLTFEKRL